MKTKSLNHHLNFWLLPLTLAAGSLNPASAQDAVYAARVASTSSTIWDAPFYWIDAGAYSPYGTSTYQSSATDPVGTPSRLGSYYHTARLLSVGEGFGLVHTKGTQANAVYEVQVTQPSYQPATDVIMNVGSTNCDIGGVFGATAAGGWTNTTAFQAAYASDHWALVCYLTNRSSVTQPHIDFKYVSGGGTSSLRAYADCVRFHLVSVAPSCQAVGPCSVPGPVSTNNSFVTVTGVTNASDLAVVVYQKVSGNVTTIGTLTSGITTGANQVPVTWTSSSVGAQIAATQINPDGIESCVTWPGYVIGGGANPPLRVSLNLKTSPNNLNAGPAGAPGDTTGTPGLFFIPGVAGTVPNGGVLVQPGTNWQTIVIDPRTAGASTLWSGTHSGSALSASDNVSTWSSLDSFVLQMEDATDTGPFEVFIDNIYSGATLLTDFDACTAGSAEFFVPPSWSDFPAGELEGPDSALVDSASSASGGNASHVKFQFSSGSTTNWVRLLAQGGSFLWPQISMTNVFQFDMLLLPKGETAGYAVGAAPPLADQTIRPGNSFVVAVNVTPPGYPPVARAYTYQWSRNGGTILGATTSGYTNDLVLPGNAGTYSVVVGDSSGSTLTRSMVLTVTAPVEPATLSIETGPGSNYTIHYSGGQAANYILLTSPVANPLMSDWSPAATNSGTLSSSNFVVTPSGAPTFYRVSSRSY